MSKYHYTIQCYDRYAFTIDRLPGYDGDEITAEEQAEINARYATAHEEVCFLVTNHYPIASCILHKTEN